MLLGALPPVANAKDDGYVLYSEDGVEMKKMKREFFTADVEKMGCDYWKEGTGDDLQNTGGKIDPYDPRIFDGSYGYIDDTTTYVDPKWSNGYMASSSLYAGGASKCANQMKALDKNYYIYDASKVKKYRHYGDFWLCLKLRDGESEVNSDFIICGERAQVHPTYKADPSQTWARIISVSQVDGFPTSVFKYPGTGGGGAISTPVLRYLGQVTGYAKDPVTQYWLKSYAHFYNKDSNTVVATFNRHYGYGLRGVKCEGTTFASTVHYRDWYLSDAVSFKSTPPLTQTNTYELKFDEEIKRLAHDYYDMDTEYDEPETIPEIVTWTKLDTDGLKHKLWKLGIGDTILEAPTQIKPGFYHILPLLNTKSTIYDYLESINAPRGVLRSIAVGGVESLSTPIYNGYQEEYYSGKSLNYFLSVEDYYSYLEIYTYYKSLAMYPLQTSVATTNMIHASTPYYYVNDLESKFVTHNFFAMGRKGIEISLYRFSTEEHSPKHSYYNEGIWNDMVIGCDGFMDSDDLSDVTYENICYHTHYTSNHDDDPLKPGDRWKIEKYGDGNLEINKVRVNTSLIDYSYYPPMNCDYVWLDTYYNQHFKSRFTAADDYIFDTNHTLNVVRNISNPETGAAYDKYSLRTLWKMNININGVTQYSLDTTFPNARPQVMKLNFNPNASTNYGFGNEFSIDTTNNKVSRLGVRVDSNNVRRAGAQMIRGNCLIMRDNTGAYQSIRLTGSGSWANQGNTSAKFRPENIYYCTRAVEAGTTIYDEVNAYVSPLYSSYKHIYYRDVSGWSTPYTYYSGKPLYLVGTIDSEGWFSVVSMMYDNRARRYGYMTQDLPTSADGLYYIYLGRFVYDGGTYSYFELEENHPIYYYKYGRINEYHYRPQDLNDFVVYENSQSTPVSAVTNRGEVDLRFSSAFNNTWDDTTGMLTIGYFKQALPNLPLTPLVINEETAATNIAPSSYIKACDVEELLIEDGFTAYYIDFNVIFRTTDGTPMTDGVFEAMLSWSANPNYGQDWVDGTMGEPLGYFKAKRVYAPNENEIVLKMKGYFKRSAFRGAQYPYIVVKHTCSTNMDVGYSITGYQTAYPASS